MRQIKNGSKTGDHRYPKLSHDFPLLAAALDMPVVVSYGTILLAFVLGFLSLHYSLSILILLTGFLAIYFEREFTEQWMFAPLFLCIVPYLIGPGLGTIFYVIGTNGLMEGPIIQMQLNYIGGFICLCLGYFLTRGKHQVLALDFHRAQFYGAIVRPLINLGWILYVMVIGLAWMAAIAGFGDRGHAGEYFVVNQFGWWTIFQAFRNVFTIGLILFPLIYANSRMFVRIGLLLSLAIHFALMFASGSREQFLAPIVFLCLGMYIFNGGRKIRLQWVVVALTPVALISFFVLNLFRDTQGFSDTRLVNMNARLGAVSELQNSYFESDDVFIRVGLQFIEVSDPIIYSSTPSVVPYAGWENIGAIAWTWLPYAFYQNRPQLIDGDAIVSYYTNNYNDRSSTKISLEADLYRRFGEIGVFVGLFVFGLLYGLVVRFAFRLMNYHNALLGILAYLLLLTYFRTGLKNQTLLTTWWQLGYEIPKDFIPLLGMSLVLSSKLGLKMMSGLIPKFDRHVSASGNPRDVLL